MSAPNVTPVGSAIPVEGGAQDETDVVEYSSCAGSLDPQDRANGPITDDGGTSVSKASTAHETLLSTPESRSVVAPDVVNRHLGTQTAPALLQEVRFASRELLCPWFPEADPKHKRAQTLSVRLARRRTVLWLACIAAWAVFAVNLIVTSYLPNQGDTAILYTGTCNTASRLDSGLHILINFLSSILLGASNLCMQLLSAPTREEVDRAHSQKKWLDIGIPSTRNLRHIAKRRISAWLFLAAASLPLHFLANSAIISVKPQAELFWSVVTPGFLNGDRVDIAATNATLMSRASEIVVGLHGLPPRPVVSYLGMPYDPYSLWSNWPYAGKTLSGYLDYLTSLQNRIEGSQRSASLDVSEYQNISRFECLSRYVKWFETGASNVLLVSSSDALDPQATVLESNSSLLAFNWIANSWDSLQAGYSQWPCNSSNNFTCAYFNWHMDTEEASTWNVFGYNIDYCLSKQLDLTHKCHVEINKAIMIAICISNFCKCLAICYTMWIYSNRDTIPLASLGDAAVSFLENPDKTTENMSLASRKNIDLLWEKSEPAEWIPYRYRWYTVGSRKLWFGLIAVILVTLGIAHYLLSACFKAVQGLNITTFKFGQPNPYEQAPWVVPRTTVIAGTMFANCWQVLISLIYVQCNCMLTAFLVGDEWSRFACGQSTKADGVTLTYSERKPTSGAQNPLYLCWLKVVVKLKKLVSSKTGRSRRLYSHALRGSAKYFWKPTKFLRDNVIACGARLGFVRRAPQERVRKTLRVSAPEGIQRSSYFVSMPWKYGVPLIASTSLLHWLISQAVFLFAVEIYDGRGRIDFRRFGCGYSVQAIVCAIALGWALLLVLIILGSRRYPPDMPLASTCSAAISAACHPPPADVDVHLFPIQWGVVSTTDDRVGHCSLTTARDVSAPQAGRLYA